MNIFIPITDDMLEQDVVPDKLVPYQPGQPLLSQLQTHTSPAQSRSTTNRSPNLTPSSIADPALSSSTY